MTSGRHALGKGPAPPGQNRNPVAALSQSVSQEPGLLLPAVPLRLGGDEGNGQWTGARHGEGFRVQGSGIRGQGPGVRESRSDKCKLRSAGGCPILHFALLITS